MPNEIEQGRDPRKDIMKTREQLKSEACRVRDEINALDAKEFREQIVPKHKGYVGKAFVYRRNSYSCPSKPSDYWDCFRLVLAIQIPKGESALYLLYEEVSIDSRGRATLCTGTEIVMGLKEHFGAGWKPCLLAEYRVNKGKVRREFTSLSALKKANRAD